MKKLFLFVLLIVFACGNDEVEPPEGLLSKEKMISFLVDLHLAEAKIDLLRVKSDSARLLFKHYEKYLFEKHHIIDSVYYKSFEYYVKDLETMNEIYSAVLDSLNVMSTMQKSELLDLEKKPEDIPE